MPIESMELETPLPENLSQLRMTIDSESYIQGPREKKKRPDENELNDLIKSGYDGLARFLIQDWFTTNTPDIRLLEILVGTRDRTVKNHQYIEWINELIKLDPGNEAALESSLFHKENEDTDFGEVAEKLLSINPKNYAGRRQKILSLIEQEEFAAALERCEEILANDSENDFALRNRAIICTHLGRVDDAAFFWSEWLKLGRAPIGDWFRAARSHYNSKHYSECISLIEQKREKFDNKEEILDLLIRAKYSQFDWHGCYDLCGEILSLNSRNPTGLKYMRLTKARIGRKMVVIPSDTVNNLNESEEEILFWFEFL